MYRLNIIKLLRNKFIHKLGKLEKVAFNKRYLFYTNIVISVISTGAGDLIRQNYEIFNGHIEKWDLQRTVNMSISGIPMGVLGHYYYYFLDEKFPGKTLKVLTQKLLIDQFICSPVCIALFFVTLAILEGSTFEEMCIEAKQKAWQLYVAEWVVWPPAQLINFYFLPRRYRLLYDSMISLGYDIYRSYVKHNKMEFS